MKTHPYLRTLTLGMALVVSGAVVAPMVVAKSKQQPTSPVVHKPVAKPVVITMSPAKNVIQNVDGVKSLSTLASALKAAGLTDALTGAGPFTVFAPNNQAFAMLPAGTMDNLLKPENKTALAQMLSYHVIAGKLTSADLAKAVQAGGGTTTLKTIEGDALTISKDAGRLAISDDFGHVAHITQGDLAQSNGFIFVIDQAMQP